MARVKDPKYVCKVRTNVMIHPSVRAEANEYVQKKVDLGDSEYSFSKMIEEALNEYMFRYRIN